MCSYSRLHYLPLTLFFFFPFSFISCYLIALSFGHINAFFAFISDAGTIPPEQNVFAQLINLGAALFAYFTYIRYKQVEQYIRLRYQKPMSIGNVIALAFGFISALGMSLVANFPELYQKEIHVLGAFLTFVGGSIYIVFQGHFTFKMIPHMQSKSIAYIRTFLGILGLMLYFGAQITVIIAFQQLEDKIKHSLEKPEALKWNVNEGGYRFRAASVIMEWLLVVIFSSFILTFVGEFKRFKLDEPQIRFLVDVTSTQSPFPVDQDTNVEDQSHDWDDRERQTGLGDEEYSMFYDEYEAAGDTNQGRMFVAVQTPRKPSAR